MEGLNRIIFLVLGLVAVIIFFAVLTGRINLKGKLPLFSDGTPKETVTPTPTPKPSNTASTPIKSGSTETKNNSPSSQNKPYNTNSQIKTTTKPITAIPATGISEFFFAFTFVLLGVGLYFKLTKGQSPSG